MSGAAPIQVRIDAPATNFADLIWPARAGRTSTLVRSAALIVLGAGLLALGAKVVAAGPVNVTLQSLAVLALGALFGLRLSVAAVALYLLEGCLGLPVFTGTPPASAGITYMAGPSGGYLAGFLGAAGMVGFAADRGLIERPRVFALVLLAADVLVLACGCLWLALFAKVGPDLAGIGFARAFLLGVKPFLLAEALKTALAAIALPVVWELARRRLGR